MGPISGRLVVCCVLDRGGGCGFLRVAEFGGAGARSGSELEALGRAPFGGVSGSLILWWTGSSGEAREGSLSPTSHRHL